VDLANSAADPVLILVSTIEHGEALKLDIFDSEICHAGLPKKTRAQIISDYREGKIHCLIATSLADEGLDVPRATVLILAAGGRSAAKLEQRAGRVMRPHEDKEFGVIHDFADRAARLAHAQHTARLRTYKRLGYEITK
jgi:superfamily II DNA or RNA helicase